jgi:hypothetical protein
VVFVHLAIIVAGRAGHATGRDPKYIRSSKRVRNHASRENKERESRDSSSGTELMDQYPIHRQISTEYVTSKDASGHECRDTQRDVECSGLPPVNIGCLHNER